MSDLRFAFRMLRKHLGFAVVVALTPALASGELRQTAENPTDRTHNP